MKKIVKRIFLAVPIINIFFSKYIYRKRLYGSNEALLSLLRHTGHSIDHLISRGEKPYRKSMLLFRLILAEAQKRGLIYDDVLSWALEKYSISKLNLISNYATSLSLDNKQEHREDIASTPLVETILRRRSVRTWNVERVMNANEILPLIDLAKWSPSSCNRQTWKVLIIEKEADKIYLGNLYSAHNKFWVSAPIILVILIESSSYHTGQEHYVYLDAGAFIQNLLLLFHSKGFGACWIGFHAWNIMQPTKSVTGKSEDFRSHFNLSEEMIPVSIVPVGYPAVTPKAPSRKSLDNIIVKT